MLQKYVRAVTAGQIVEDLGSEYVLVECQNYCIIRLTRALRIAKTRLIGNIGPIAVLTLPSSPSCNKERISNNLAIKGNIQDCVDMKAHKQAGDVLFSKVHGTVTSVKYYSDSKYFLHVLFIKYCRRLTFDVSQHLC